MNNMFLPQTNIVRWMDMTDFPKSEWIEEADKIKLSLIHLIII